MMLGPLLLGRTPSLKGMIAAGTAVAGRHALDAATPSSEAIAAPSHHHLPSCRRCISEETLNASRDQVADLLSRNVARQQRGGGGGVLLPRREALALYREILRYSNLFVWRDDKGRRWRDVIRESARKEFEDARFERDPAIVSKLIVTGRDCVERTVEAFLKRRQRIIEEEASQQDAAATAAADQEHRRQGGLLH